MKRLLFFILVLILASCGKKSDPNSTDPSYVSITKEEVGSVSCQGCFLMDYRSTLFYISYQSVDVENCEGAAVYEADRVIVMPTVNGQKLNYDVSKISGPNDINCFPQDTIFEITSQSNNSDPGLIEFFTGLDLYDMCLSTGCN